MIELIINDNKRFYCVSFRYNMQLRWLPLIYLISVIKWTRADICKCDHYLSDGKTLVLSTGHVYKLMCDDILRAKEQCAGLCRAEVRNYLLR